MTSSCSSESRGPECRWGLYTILDPEVVRVPPLEAARQLVAGGARVIQLRDKKRNFEEQVELGKELRRLTREAGVALIINDNPYLAREIDADGVHVGQSDMPVFLAREIVGPNKIVGLSTHNVQQLAQARREEVDYIGVGPIYESQTKVSEWTVLGLPLVRMARTMVPYPIVAIGGITDERIPEVIEAGADNVALIRELLTAPDLQQQTERLRNTVAESLSRREESRGANNGR